MLEKGKLARWVERFRENESQVCLILSLDPPTRCCGWEPCGHKVHQHRMRPSKVYTPMARIVWQSGPKAGQESMVMTHLLEVIQ